MKHRIYALKEAEKIVPLLRSIGREIQSRRRLVGEIQNRLGTARSLAKPGSAALSNLEAELATQLREIHAAERELDRLGCRIDERHPQRILIPSPEGDLALDERLEDTRFYPASAGGAA